MSFVLGNGDIPGVLFHGNGPVLLPSRIHTSQPMRTAGDYGRCVHGGGLTYTFYRPRKNIVFREGVNLDAGGDFRPFATPPPAAWRCRNMVDVASLLRQHEHLSNLLLQQPAWTGSGCGAVSEIMTCRKE